jgi:hypothetical protein
MDVLLLDVWKIWIKWRKWKMNELEDFVGNGKEAGGLKTFFESQHFDKNKQPKTLRISLTLPKLDEQWHNVRGGNIVLAVLSKNVSAGISLHTGEIAELIYSLERAQEELLKATYRLHRGPDSI